MTHRFWRLIILISVWHVAASACYYAVFAGTPFLARAFSLSNVSVGFVVTALMLGYAVFLLPIGVLTDRFGERRTLTLGLLGLAVGVSFVALAPTYGLLLVAAFLLGSAYGTATPGTNKAIFDNVAPERQHRAIGIKQTGPTLGSALGSVLVTGLAGIVFWEFGFFVAAGIGVLVALTFYVLYADAETADASLPEFRGLLGERAYLLVVTAGVCIGAGFYTTTAYTVLYLTDSVGAAVAVAGLVLALLQVVSSASRIAVGYLGDALPGDPRQRLGAILTVQVVGGALVFAGLPAAQTVSLTVVAFVVLGLFALGSVGMYYSVISTTVDTEQIGSASAGGQFALTLGGLVTPPVFGYLADTQGYATSWTFLGALSLLAGVLIIAAIFTSREPTGSPDVDE